MQSQVEHQISRFRVQTLVGRKYGGWTDSALTFDEPELASVYLDILRQAEIKAGATPLHRRVVRA